MKGNQGTRTKAQNLAEIVQKQNGFLTGLNTDSPKSDVGDTQVTVLENMLPFRDRVEARGGLIPQTKYLQKDIANNATIFHFNGYSFYDKEWDEIFAFGRTVSTGDTGVVNYGTQDKDMRHIEGYATSPTLTHEARIGEKIAITTTSASPNDENSIIQLNNSGGNYVLRPFTSDGGSPTDPAPRLVSTGSGSAGHYGYIYTFIRIFNGIMEAESPRGVVDIQSLPAEFDGTTTPISLFSDLTANSPTEYYLQGGSDNFFTHIRYYRTEVQETALEAFNSTTFYSCGDYDLSDITPPPLTTLDLNVADTELTQNSSRSVYWTDGYIPIPSTNIMASSSGIFFARNEARTNEYIYCPIGAGEQQKYMGWYNPLFQYGTVDGEITSMTDMGSYVMITTNQKTYYVDSVNYIEDEGNVQARVFTPILSSAVMVNKEIGVNYNQRRALVLTSSGGAIGLTASGEIREFNNYQWGVDLSVRKVHSITKGDIAQNKLYCDGEFANDAYYLFYLTEGGGSVVDKISTLRLGTTEESGYGFSILTGEDNSSGWPVSFLVGGSGGEAKMGLNIKGVLHVFKASDEEALFTTPASLMEYTGDKFDNKVNKDVIDSYIPGASLTDPMIYQSTSYESVGAEVEMPEVTGASESDFLYFLKTNFYLRPDRFAYKVTDEGATRGYQITNDNIENVSLSDVTFGMDVRKGDSEVVYAFNNGFSPVNGVVTQREVQDHRIRISLRGDNSGFQLTGYEAHFKRHRRKDLGTTTTTDTTFSLASGLYCLINQNMKNFAVGNSRSSAFDVGAPIEGSKMGGTSSHTLVAGDVPTIVTGPDANLTGISLTSGTILEFQASSVPAPTAATVMYWEDGATGSIQTGWTSDLVDMYTFTGTNTGAWTHTAHVHDGVSWLVYTDGVLQTTTAATLQPYIKTMSLRVNGEGIYSDIRMYNKEITASELLFYINNVLNNEGDYINGN